MTPALSFGKIYDSRFPETVYIPGGRMGRRIGEIVICLPGPNDPRRFHLGSVRFWDSASKALGQGRRRPMDTSDTTGDHLRRLISPRGHASVYISLREFTG